MLFIEKLLSIITLILPILIAVAFFTIAERKIMASIQQRRGPNVVGFNGLLQAIADALKLMLKETVIPTNVSSVNYVIAPVMSFLISLLA